MSNPHSKTPGGSGASAKMQKQMAEKQGSGTAPEAPGASATQKPGEAAVASDSGATRVGIEPGTNQPGEKGIKDTPVPGETTSGSGGGGANMK